MTRTLRSRLLGPCLFLPLLLALGCGGESGALVTPVSDAASGGDAADAGAPDSASPSGPTIRFHVRTTTAPFAHADGLSGQTTRQTKQGIRRLRLLRSAADPAPVVAFDHGQGFVEAGYDDGDDTEVGAAPLSRLAAGRFTVAQIVVTHSRFRVSSTMHALGGAFPGEFDCVQALSDDTTLQGAARKRGWYRYVFQASGQSYPQEGASAPLPSSPATGGFVMKTEGAETFYEVPVDLVIDPGVTSDVRVTFDVNMDRSFHWEDQRVSDYAAGVYDTTPTSFEPIRRYGANSFAVRVDRASR